MPRLRGPIGTVLSRFIYFLHGEILEDRPHCPTTVLPKLGGPLGQALSPLHCPPRLGGPKDRPCLPFVAPPNGKVLWADPLLLFAVPPD